MLYLIYFLVTGLIVGWIAYKIHPGEEEGGILGMIITGVAGSFLGGVINWLIWGGTFSAAGLIMSIVGGVAFCWIRGGK